MKVTDLHSAKAVFTLIALENDTCPANAQL